MSGGYLQRLLNGVTQHRDSLRPRTGSIFSPHREETNAPLQAWEETDTVAAAQSQGEATSSELEQPAPAPVKPKSEHVPILPNTVAPARSTEQEAPRLPAVLRPERRSVAPRVGRAAEPSRSALAPASTVDVDSPEGSVADDGFRALMRPDGLSRADLAVVEPRQPPQERHTSRSERQADEIQIHIGRIEVTAVSRAVAPAPKVHDRSLSLDAYLNRRDGRPR